MTVAPDYFLPALFDLSASTVQGIQTGATNPRMVMDSSGLWASRADGRKTLWLPPQYDGLMFPMNAYTETRKALAFTVDGDTDARASDPLIEVNANRSNDRGKRSLTTTTNPASSGTYPATEGEHFLTGPGYKLRLSTVQRVSNIFVTDRMNYLLDTPDALPGILEIVFSAAADGTGVWRTILDAYGNSTFLSTDDGATIKVHRGSVTFVGVAIGSTFNNFAVPWLVANYGCLVANVVPASQYGAVVLPRTLGPGTCSMVISNNPAVQDYTIEYLAFGK